MRIWVCILRSDIGVVGCIRRAWTSVIKRLKHSSHPALHYTSPDPPVLLSRIHHLSEYKHGLHQGFSLFWCQSGGIDEREWVQTHQLTREIRGRSERSKASESFIPHIFIDLYKQLYNQISQISPTGALMRSASRISKTCQVFIFHSKKNSGTNSPQRPEYSEDLKSWPIISHLPHSPCRTTPFRDPHWWIPQSAMLTSAFRVKYSQCP